MNALDKLIGYFSPERAYRRARFRAATETFAYDGAKSGRRTDGWVAAGGDANSEIGASLISLRNRSRDLLRNNPYASKAIAELVGNTVGTGIVPQAKTGTPDLDKIIDNEWQYFAENCDPGATPVAGAGRGFSGCLQNDGRRHRKRSAGRPIQPLRAARVLLALQLSPR